MCNLNLIIFFSWVNVLVIVIVVTMLVRLRRWPPLRCSEKREFGPIEYEEGGYKIFVHSYKGNVLTNLADYFRLIKQGILVEAHHREFCEAVEALRDEAETTIQRKVGIINENKLVNWLHFRMVLN